MDRQTLAGLIPLAAIAVALAEFLFDRTQPRWHSPAFWVSLAFTVGLVIVVQVLRFGGAARRGPSKPPDISARTIVGNRDLLGPGSAQRTATSERDEK